MTYEEENKNEYFYVIRENYENHCADAYQRVKNYYGIETDTIKAYKELIELGNDKPSWFIEVHPKYKKPKKDGNNRYESILIEKYIAKNNTIYDTSGNFIWRNGGNEEKEMIENLRKEFDETIDDNI